MLQLFFAKKELCQNLLDGPMGPYLPSLAGKLSELGYSRSQGQRLLLTADALGRWLQEKGVSPTEATVDHVRTYAAIQQRTAAGNFPDTATGLTHLMHFLKPWGVFCKPLPSSPADQWLQRFDNYLERVRGLSQSTRHSYLHRVRRFVRDSFAETAPEWTALTTLGICQFVQTEMERTPGGKGAVVSSLRTFLRFLLSEGQISASLIRAIPRVRRWHDAALPRPLSAEELENVIAACQSPWGGTRRDRAFILLLARLGLRGGEVRQLRIEDFDWTEGLIHIRRSKTFRERALPLPCDVGTVITDYIQHERPRSPYREVFLTASTPHEPLTTATTPTFMTRRFLERIGLHGRRLGTHCFRHTAASQMVRNGAPLKDVADVLGHRSLRTTSLYIKLDEAALASVALPWPGGEL